MDQKALTKAQLKPYLTLVKKRMAKNAESIAWVSLDERWRALVDHAEGILAAFAKGKAGSRFERVAAQEAVKLAKEVKAEGGRRGGLRDGHDVEHGAPLVPVR